MVFLLFLLELKQRAWGRLRSNLVPTCGFPLVLIDEHWYILCLQYLHRRLHPFGALQETKTQHFPLSDCVRLQFWSSDASLWTTKKAFSPPESNNYMLQWLSVNNCVIYTPADLLLWNYFTHLKLPTPLIHQSVSVMFRLELFCCTAQWQVGQINFCSFNLTTITEVMFVTYSREELHIGSAYVVTNPCYIYK